MLPAPNGVIHNGFQFEGRVLRPPFTFKLTRNIVPVFGSKDRVWVTYR